MQSAFIRRFAPLGGTLAFLLAPTWVMAQDGQPATGAPVTNPRTNSGVETGQTGGSTTPNTTVPGGATGTEKSPRTTNDILSGVPETARDPAPPGTRGIRVDMPGAKTNTLPNDKAGQPNQPSAGAATARNQRGVHTAEGVVTRIDKPGKTVQSEQIRFAFDPSQDWATYVDRGAMNIPEDADRPKTKGEVEKANEQMHADHPDAPKVLEMVVSPRSYLYTYARSAEGMDMYGAATSSSPDRYSSISGATERGLPRNGAAEAKPQPTNFTNIKEGSFVAVRYRKVGDVNEVLNLSLIEFPINTRANGETPAGTNPGAIGPLGGPKSSTPATPSNVRIPTVPGQPVGGTALPR